MFDGGRHLLLALARLAADRSYRDLKNPIKRGRGARLIVVGFRWLTHRRILAARARTLDAGKPTALAQ